MRSHDKTGDIPDLIVLAWKEVRLRQSSANTTQRLAQDFCGCCCKPYGFFIFFVALAWAHVKLNNPEVC